MQKLTAQEDLDLRHTAFEWLKIRSDDGASALTRDDILDFEFNGQRTRLQPTQKGIWNPAFLHGALSFMTSYRAPGRERPYEDVMGADGLPRYMWQGDDPYEPTNQAMRYCLENELPLIWFIGVGMNPAAFQAVCPVYLLAEEWELKRFVVAPVDEEAFFARDRTSNTVVQETVKKYISRESRVRLHQPVFRSTILSAYEDRCSICNLGHRQLLDAAHIVPDAHELGAASVTNGIALCKIHHAAFDSHILGIRPDHVVQIRPDLLDEIDGPMLQHGLKELHGGRLMKLPRQRSAWPKVENLKFAYDAFLTATAS